MSARDDKSLHEGWDIKELWEKHEDVAMHFNDLIMRLRTQALAGVAAIAALVGIFAKENANEMRYSWEIAALVFFGLACFWIAIWCLDFGYYNKLLSGAVASLKALEDASKKGSRITSINLSTIIEDVVQGKRTDVRTLRHRIRSRWGIVTFYLIVLGATLAGGAISLKMDKSVSTQSAGVTAQIIPMAKSVPSNKHSKGPPVKVVP